MTSTTLSTFWHRLRSIPTRVLVFAIELYRTYVSPTRMPTCRFTPTCSEYAVDALREYGAVRGLGLTVVRLVKCAPWHPGGWDPIPERAGSGAQTATSHHCMVSVNEQRST